MVLVKPVSLSIHHFSKPLPRLCLPVCMSLLRYFKKPTVRGNTAPSPSSTNTNSTSGSEKINENEPQLTTSTSLTSNSDAVLLPDNPDSTSTLELNVKKKKGESNKFCALLDTC